MALKEVYTEERVYDVNGSLRVALNTKTRQATLTFTNDYDEMREVTMTLEDMREIVRTFDSLIPPRVSRKTKS